MTYCQRNKKKHTTYVGKVNTVFQSAELVALNRLLFDIVFLVFSNSRNMQHNLVILSINEHCTQLMFELFLKHRSFTNSEQIHASAANKTNKIFGLCKNTL